MSETTIKRVRKLQGAMSLPGDKSISHRAALLSLVCDGSMAIRNYAAGDDCRRTLDAVAMLGATVEIDGSTVKITPPAEGIQTPDRPIECDNSGTTMRLLAGLLAGSDIEVSLFGDESLSNRPMKRIVDPLTRMNAQIRCEEDGTPPLYISPSRLIPIEYTLPVASAQVKSALLLAGLSGRCGVTVRENIITRDHTERMIRHLGGDLAQEDIKAEIIPDPNDPRKKKKVLSTDEYKRALTLNGAVRLTGSVIEVPGDISTAANFITAALLLRGSHVILKGVGVNATRLGFIHTLKVMGAEIALKNKTEICGEPRADIEVHYSKLKPRKISGEQVAAMIDELPLLALIAATLEGTTVVRDAKELRHKESDRIHAIAENLKRMDVKIGEFPDGFAIEGRGDLEGAELDSFGDHRIAMVCAVAGMVAHGKTTVADGDVVATSCPDFMTMLEGLRVK